MTMPSTDTCLLCSGSCQERKGETAFFFFFIQITGKCKHEYPPCIACFLSVRSCDNAQKASYKMKQMKEKIE